MFLKEIHIQKTIALFNKNAFISLDQYTDYILWQISHCIITVSETVPSYSQVSKLDIFQTVWQANVSPLLMLLLF